MSGDAHLQVPITEAAVRDLRIGQEVYLSGHAFQLRGPASARAIEMLGGGQKLPFDLTDGILYHAYSKTEEGDGRWQFSYVGPTLSYRMNKYLPTLIRELRVRAVIGKAGAGVDESTVSAMRTVGCVHLVQVGGTAAFHRQQLGDDIEVFWPELGSERAVRWQFRNFGPLFVSVDTVGGQLFSPESYVEHTDEATHVRNLK